MGEDSPKTVYSVDTNVLMDWQARYYPTDVFPSLIGWIDSLVSAGRWVSPEIVREESNVVGTAEMAAWANDRPQAFVPLDEMLAEGLAIQGRFPGLKDPKAEYEEADAYVIALARLRDGVVVTQETPAAEKRNPRRSHFIPDVCRELGLPCISFLGLMRREKWTF